MLSVRDGFRLIKRNLRRGALKLEPSALNPTLHDGCALFSGFTLSSKGS